MYMKNTKNINQKMEGKAKKASNEQKDYLVQYMENELAAILNGLGGAVKEASKWRKYCTDQKISALDPAFPLFYGTLSTHLSKHDADFVDVIHTDAWIYGAPVSTGTADFWPNGGATLQPGCPKRNYKPLTDNDLCSHRRSWWYWAESVSNEYTERFFAVKAKSWTDFKNERFMDEGSQAVMGHDCPTNISGDFYLQTNGVPPYARDLAGMSFVHASELIGNIEMC